MFFLLIFPFLQIHTDPALKQLPKEAIQVVDEHLTVNWKLLGNHIYKCNLNGDSLSDYALAATVGKGNSRVEYYFALIAHKDGYAFHLLTTMPAELVRAGGVKFILRHKGEKATDFPTSAMGEPKQIILPTDAIEFVPNVGCCSTIQIFRDGFFQMITSGD